MAATQDEIRQALLKIPHGKVMSYKSLGQSLGVHPRAVASAMRHNKHPEIYPCYKVVSIDGSLTGYSAPGGIKTKKKMLQDDGVGFIGDKVALEYIL